MSLSRLALRLAAVEALCPSASATAGPWPTAAAGRVYDSRIDLISGAISPEEMTAALRDLENKPLLVVYTEEQETSPYGTAAYPAKEEVVDLVVEAMIASTGVIEVQQEDGSVEPVGAIEAPVTDRESEALLDVLEAQVRRLLDVSQRAPSSALLFKVAMETRHIHSVPSRAADRALRLAGRTIKFKTKVKATVWPQATSALPEPLASVAAGLAPGSSGAAVCATVAGLIPGAPALPPALERVDIVTRLGATTSFDDPDAVRASVQTS